MIPLFEQSKTIDHMSTVLCAISLFKIHIPHFLTLILPLISLSESELQ